jgi:hypothetical protein
MVMLLLKSQPKRKQQPRKRNSSLVFNSKIQAPTSVRGFYVNDVFGNNLLKPIESGATLSSVLFNPPNDSLNPKGYYD